MTNEASDKIETMKSDEIDIGIAELLMKQTYSQRLEFCRQIAELISNDKSFDDDIDAQLLAGVFEAWAASVTEEAAS